MRASRSRAGRLSGPQRRRQPKPCSYIAGQMRDTQLRRRLFYLAFGALPAPAVLYLSGSIPDAIASVRSGSLWSSVPELLMAGSGVLGTLGLWIALAMRLPVRKRWHHWAIAALLLAGLVIELPSFVFSGVSFAEAPRAGNLPGIAARGGPFWIAMLLGWLGVGPLALGFAY